MAVCAVCYEDNAADARFCSSCGARLSDPVRAREVRKTVTVVFCDLVGSAELGDRLDPESYRRLMARYWGETRRVVERHGGTVEKFIGDAVMAVFGLPAVHEDDALRAVRAAAGVRARIDALNAEFEQTWGARVEIRVGVNTGEVASGDVATGHAFASGDAIVVAQRLEAAAEPGEILVGDTTARLVQGDVTLESLPALQVKGKSLPLRAWRFVDERPPVSPRARLESPLVGRSAELASLLELFDDAVECRQCRVGVVLGEAGVGKSRLSEEAAAAVGRRATVLRGRCVPYGEGITYWPIREVVRLAAEIPPDASAREARDRVAALYGDGSDAEVVVGRVASAIGLDETKVRSDELFWAIRRLLETIADRRPLVVVLDDLQWAEPTLLDLVEYLAGWSRAAPLLVICLARTDVLEIRPSWAAGRARVITLEPLSGEQSERLVFNLVGRRLSSTAVREIVRSTDGNPLFVEETLRMLIDEGLLLEGEGGWHGDRPLGTVATPATIQAVLSARLDLLGENERALLQRAAVIGEVFSWRAIAAIAGPELGGDIGPQLHALVRKQLVEPEAVAAAEGDAFAFRHILVRDAAYQSLPKEQRSILHERFGAWIEEEDADGNAELVGHHLEQAANYAAELEPGTRAAAGLRLRASEALARAGRHAHNRGDEPAAAALFLRAAALRPEADRARHRLVLDGAVARRGSGDYEGSLEVLESLLARDLDARVEYTARLERAHCLLSLGKARSYELVAVAERAVELFEDMGDDAGLAHARNRVAFDLFVRGRFGAAAEMFERARTHAVRVGDVPEEVRSLAAIANTLWLGPLPAEDAAELGRRILDRLGELESTATSIPAAALAGVEAMRGAVEDAWAVYARARATADQRGVGMELAAIPLVAAPLLALHPATAEADLRVAYGVLEAAHEQGALSSVAAFLAGAVLAQGRVDEAEELTFVSEAAAPADDMVSQVIWRVVRSRVALARGHDILAREIATAAVVLARQSDSPVLQGDALLALAEASSAEPDALAALEAAREALALFTEKGSETSASAASGLLRSLDAEVAKL